MDRAVPENGFYLVEVEVLERNRQQQQELVMWFSEKPREGFLIFFFIIFFMDYSQERVWGI